LNELNRTEVYHDFLSFLSATQGGLVKWSYTKFKNWFYLSYCRF
jgi:hypothetical protein